MMKERSFVLFVALVLLAVTVSAGQAHSATPLTLTLPHCTLPTWVDARIAVDATGHLDPRYFGNDHRMADVLASAASDGCHAVGTWYVDAAMPPLRGSLHQAILNSEVAVLGRVASKSYGFYGSVPGQLVQIVPERVVGAKLPKAAYYYFVPVGTFSVGKEMICKTDWRYAPPPEIGQEVFIFAKVPIDPDRVLLNVLGPGDVVGVSGSGTLELPRQYQPAAASHRNVPSAMPNVPANRGELLDALLTARRAEVQK